MISHPVFTVEPRRLLETALDLDGLALQQGWRHEVAVAASRAAIVWEVPAG